ncbi:MAG TPA: cytochrome o ubiquinol oxidase subunit III [Caulobacteraceae bacterium]|nr:cytochrome o ubiquinol oxidase subunit III [Caulobacteraceae bacterium]
MSASSHTPDAERTGSAFMMTTEHHPESSTYLGFWLYLMSDCLLFAGLFATFGVLGHSYAGGPGGAELFDLPTVALNTTFLLCSSITYGMAMIAVQEKRKHAALLWLAITGLFGCGFITLELKEFVHLILEGNGPQRSAFLSSFFTLVGTHGLHVTCGLIWLVTLMFQINRWGLNETTQRRLMCLSLFWHFLDVIWIGVFSFVYLLGAM